jgi:hypothetical protein
MTSNDYTPSVVIDGCRVERLPQKNFSVPVTFKFKVEKVFESYHPDPETAFHYHKNSLPSKAAWPIEYESVIDGFTISRVSTIGTPFKYKIKEKNEYFNSNSHDIGVAFYRYCLVRNPYALPEGGEKQLGFVNDFPWVGRTLGTPNSGFGGFGATSSSGGLGAPSSNNNFRSSQYTGCCGNSTPPEDVGKKTKYVRDGNFDLKISKKETEKEKQEPITEMDQTI